MKILFLTENFGYGPVTTLCEIAKKIKETDKAAELLFLGDKHLCEVCQNSYLFNSITQIETYDVENIKKHKDLFFNSDKIVAVETTNVLIKLFNLYDFKNIYLVDNLFWLWDFLEDELKHLKKYFISTIIPVEDNIKRIANDFTNLQKVGPIRCNQYYYDCRKNNNLMISFGGGESQHSNEKVIINYYSNVLKVLEKCNLSNYDKIFVCGGAKIITQLENTINNKQFNFLTLNHDDYIKNLYTCSHCICAPGLGNFNEIICSNIKTLFLLPINYSQYFQYYYFKQLNMDFIFDEYEINKNIPKYLEETLGVQKVISLLENNIKIKNTQKDSYFYNNFLNSKNFSIKREVFYNHINKTALEDIVKELIYEK